MKRTNPTEKIFSFADFLEALENQDSGADLEPYRELVEALAKYLNVDIERWTL